MLRLQPSAGIELLVNNQRIARVNGPRKEKFLPEISNYRQVMSKVQFCEVMGDLRVDHCLLVKTHEQAIDITAGLDIRESHSVDTLESPSSAA